MTRSCQEDRVVIKSNKTLFPHTHVVWTMIIISLPLFFLQSHQRRRKEREIFYSSFGYLESRPWLVESCLQKKKKADDLCCGCDCCQICWQRNVLEKSLFPRLTYMCSYDKRGQDFTPKASYLIPRAVNLNSSEMEKMMEPLAKFPWRLACTHTWQRVTHRLARRLTDGGLLILHFMCCTVLTSRSLSGPEDKLPIKPRWETTVESDAWLNTMAKIQQQKVNVVAPVYGAVVVWMSLRLTDRL